MSNKNGEVCWADKGLIGGWNYRNYFLGPVIIEIKYLSDEGQFFPFIAGMI